LRAEAPRTYAAGFVLALCLVAVFILAFIVGEMAAVPGAGERRASASCVPDDVPAADRQPLGAARRDRSPHWM
jgi:hypothetical protein